MNLYHTQSTKQFVEGTTPTAPPSGVVTLFASASALNVIDSGGNVTEIGGGGGGGVTVSDTAPSSPANGDLWFNSDTGSLYVWYVDADGGQWVLPDLNISTGIISLSSQVAHILPVENGGTGASSLSSVSLSSFSSESATDGYVATADGAGGVEWEEAAVGLTNFTEGRDDTGINASTPVVSLSATGAETNIDAAIIPKGTGALLTAVPDGTTAGGNKRGNSAVDLSTSRSSADRIASGDSSFCGPNGKASGNGSVAFGGSGGSGQATGSNAFIGPGCHASSASGSRSVVFASNYSNASGGNSMIIGGDFSYASGSSSFCHGTVPGSPTANASGQLSFCIAGGGASAIAGVGIGFHSIATRYGEIAHSSGGFVAYGAGNAQSSELILRCKTTTNSAVEMALNGSTTYLTIPNGKVMYCDIRVVGTKSDGSSVATYARQYAVKNVSGTSSEVYSPITIGTDNAAGTSISITTNDTGDYISIQPTGIVSEVWRWVARVNAVEVAYGT